MFLFGCVCFQLTHKGGVLPAEMAPPVNTQPADELEQKAERVASRYAGGAKALDRAKFAFIKKDLELARQECKESIADYRGAEGEGGYDLGPPPPRNLALASPPFHNPESRALLPCETKKFAGGGGGRGVESKILRSMPCRW